MHRKVALFSIFLCVTFSASFLCSSVPAGPSYLLNTWQTLKIGAGGYIRGIDIQCDQGVGACNGTGTTTKLARGDGYGLYSWITSGSCTLNVPAPCWKQLVTSESLPKGDPMNVPGTACLAATGGGCAAWDARIAPSNTQIFYMEYNGYIYKSTNAGSNWTATSFPQDTVSSPNAGNGIGQAGYKMAIDPANANIVIACTAANGCFQTQNGGDTWTAIIGLTNSGVLMLVAFDPTTTSGGSTPGVYICSNGTGCYHTTSGMTGTWTLLNTTGMPTTALHTIVDTAGIFWVVDNSGGGSGNVNRYTDGAWTQPLGSQCCESIAVDPNNPSHIVVVNTGGSSIVSFTGGTTQRSYSSAQTITLAAGDVPWLTTSGTFMTAGQIVFDPAQINVLFQGAGAGVWWSTVSTGSGVKWNSQNVGIENLTAVGIMSPPGGKPVISGWDYQAFVITDPDSYATPSTRATTASACCYGVWGMDWSSKTPTTLALLDNSNINTSPVDISGISTDAGASFTAFSKLGTLPAGVAGNCASGAQCGGAIAAASPSFMVWITAANGTAGAGQLWTTTDGGANWTLPSISGIGTEGSIGWINNQFLKRTPVCADRVASNTVYAYNAGGTASMAGIYKLFYNGNSMLSSRAKTGAIDGNSGNNGLLLCAPGNAGDMYWTSGNITPGPYPHAQSFYECIDTSGATKCKAIPDVKEVWSFGFGAAKPGGSGYPSIYIVGWANCGKASINNCASGASGYTFSIWRSTDHASTWTYLGVPLGILDYIPNVSGDMNTYGLVYVGFNVAGRAYGNFP